ncbi:MAG TPA: sigma-70 family RNA polymerase sigma factor [Planctomycetota bacterium]
MISSAELEGQREFLRRLARGLVRSADEADDLVQEAFVRALERPPESAQALRGWLVRVVERAALNLGRGSARLRERERRAARPERLPPPEEALASLEIGAELVAAMKALDEPYRTALWLRFHEERPPRAIARELGVSVRTVEARLARGLAALRADLDRRSGGDRARWFGAVLALARHGESFLLPTLGTVLVKKTLLAVVVVLALLLAWRTRSSVRPVRTAAGDALARVDATAEAPPGAGRRAEVSERSSAVATTPESAPSATTLLVRVRWSDGAPAGGVGLIVRPASDPRGPRAIERVETDDAGEARLSPLHAGLVRVEADRGGAVSGELRAGGTTVLELALASGVEVEGTVMDRAGLPLAGAEVLLIADRNDWLAPRVVARTGASGSYRVRDVQPELSVTARSGKLAQALLEPLRGRTGRVRIDFTLDREGAELGGIVRDARGAPVAGALVAVGDPEGWAVGDDERPGLYRPERPLRLERTDAQGRFRAPGVSPAFGLELAVQAGSFPIAVANVSASIGASSYVEIRLDDPASLVGVVRSALGAPVSGARLALVRCDGADANEVPFDLPATTTDAEGAYRLEALPPSSLLRLDPPAGGAGATTLVALALTPGESRRDLVLASDDAVRGRVQADADVRFDGWFVRALQQVGVGSLKRAPLAADGRFELAGCDQPPYRLELFAGTDRPVLRQEGVGPGEELLLVAERLGSIRGELDDGLTEPSVAPPKVLVSFREDVLLPPTWQDGGRFAFELLRPGRYRVRIERAERLLFATSLDLGPGESLDLGRIVSAPSGKLALTLDPPPEGGFGGSVLDAAHETVAFLELVEGQLGVAALPPGEHLLVLEGPRLASQIHPFTIRPGERTELVVPTRPGVERSLVFRLRGQSWEVLTVELRDARGALVLHRRIQRGYWPAAGGSPSLLVSLPVGTFEVRAETDTGLVAQGSLDVPVLEPQERALAFELR